MAGGPFSPKDADFNNQINVIIPYLNTATIKTRLVLTTVAQVALTSATGLLTTAATGWNTLYPQSTNPAANTSSITDSKNKLRDDIEGFVRTVYGDIPNSSLTQIDRDTLKIPLPKPSKSPVPVPPNAPEIAVKERAHLTATFSITDPAHSHTQAKPEGVDQIDIESAFLPNGTTPPSNFPKATDFRHLGSTGKFLYKRTYDLDQLAGTEYLRARYVNSRKEPGPWSEIISVVVS